MMIAMQSIDFGIHGIGQFDATHGIGPCVWPHFDLITVLRGLVWLQLREMDRVELEKGQSILIFPHTAFVGGSVVRSSVAAVQHFRLKTTSTPMDDSNPLARWLNEKSGYELFAINRNALFLADIRRAIQMANQPDAAVTLAMRTAMLTLILGQLTSLPKSTSNNPRESTIDFEPVTRWIAANLHQQFKLDELADLAHCSTSHFRAAFTQAIGQSPGLFVRKARQLEAARLLRETRLPIKQIARKVGYDDLAHFYRFFRGIAGVTPGEYREKHQLNG